MAYGQTNGYGHYLNGNAPNKPTSPNNASITTAYTNGRLSFQTDASQTPLPPSSPALTSPRPELGRSLSNRRTSPNPPLRRSSSALSIKSDRAPSSPALMRKSSTSSLRGSDVGTPTRLKSRTSSSQLNPNSPLPPAMEEPPVTENSVAEDWFKQELERHETTHGAVNTVVILHEACYGHRFARPKTAKGTLGLIVERPERIEASTMGISAAYVRLGERHNEGQHGPDPRIRPPAHLPFKIRRTARTLPITSPAVTQVHGSKWMDELKVMCDSASTKLAGTGRELERPVDPTNKNKPAFHSGDLYLCQESLAAFEGALGGVCDGVDAVFNGAASGEGPSQAFVCIRPPGHHCSADFPSGFCWLNNVHVGIQHAVKEHQLTHAAIIDFDLHHGDGSQQIVWEHNRKIASMPKNTPAIKKTAIGYYSIHDVNSYPCENGEPDKILNASVCIDNAHNQSIWNVHLQEWKTEAEFWELYESKYMVILEKARLFLKHHTARLRGNPNLPNPKGAIFISAGFDASEHEGAGMQRHSVNVPTEFYARFTRDIVMLAQEEGTGVDGRVISVLEGGYSDKALISGVLSHVSGLCHGQHVASSAPQPQNDGLAEQMSRLNFGGLGGLSGLPGAGQMSGIEDVALQLRYNAEWWTSEHLDALVEILNPAPRMPAVEAVKEGRVSTFASPTAASKQRQIDPEQLRRKSSMQFNRFSGSAAPSRPTTPPPPTVHWTVAAQELCKLLIPNRQTKSHTAADLTAPKIKKERASTASVGAAAPAPAGRQLREKRTTVRPSPSIPEQSEPKRVVSKGADRRRTIAANEIAAGRPSSTAAAERPRRRSSIASTISNVSAAPTVATVPTTRPKLTTASSGSGSGVQVKKTRAPVSRPPVSGARSSVPPTTAPRTNGSRAPSMDMDSLVNKTQKLKINMPPDEEYLKRGAARTSAAGATKPATAAAKKPTTEPRKVGRPPKATTATTAAAKKPTASAASKAKSPTNDPSLDLPGAGTFQVDPATAGAAAISASQLGSMEGQFQLAPPQPVATTPPVTGVPSGGMPASSPADIKFPAYGNGQPAMPSAVPATMFPTQQHPPVWSSTGPIPFATAPLQGRKEEMGVAPEQVVKQDGAGKDIWEVPDTPAK